ncbi:MAG: hypothetical protein FJZ13_00130 [Candidatus Omnitrophica bacterium]|nr:hypothetical protein [Candidatus Omnitrophota bacterium]
MKNKAIGIVVFFILLVFAAGCETTKGFGKGVGKSAEGVACVGYGMGSTVVGAVEGAGEDSYNFWKFILATDNWIKDNLW